MPFRIRLFHALPALGLVLCLGGVRAVAQGPGDCASRLPVDRVTLNLRDASAQTTLRLLAQQYKINMLVTDDVRGQVTLDFFRVPAREVFQAIIEAANLRCVAVGEVLRVSTMARLRAEEDERVKARDAELRLEADTRKRIIEARRAEEELAELTARGPIREETIRLQYADADDVVKTLVGILGLPPQGAMQAPVPLPQLSQLYVPSPPVDIPPTPQPPITAPPPPSAFALPEIIGKGLTVQAYRPTNSVFIRYYEKDIERIRRLVQEKLDIPVPQVQIAAQMVITSLNALDQIGVQWGGAGAGNFGRQTFVGQGFQDPLRPPGTGVINVNPPNPNLDLSGLLPVNPATAMPLGGNLVNLPTSLLPTLAAPAGGLLLGIIGTNFNINLAIQALEVQGKARTLAEPKVVTVENARASIARGFEVPFTSTPSQGVQQVQFKEALLKLDVTPRVIRENGDTRIRMKVVFENNEPDFTRSVGDNPPIFKRRQETEVLISQGQRLVVGGVTNDTNARTTREVPVLGQIPVLGWLFKSREISKTGEELIVILTPTVLDTPAAQRR